MESETALSPNSTNRRIRPLLLTVLVFIFGIVAGVVGTYLYFSFFGKFQAFDYSRMNWFGNTNITPAVTITPVVTVFENPFSQGGGITPSISLNPSVIPSTSPTYINPFDLIGQ